MRNEWKRFRVDVKKDLGQAFAVYFYESEKTYRVPKHAFKRFGMREGFVGTTDICFGALKGLKAMETDNE